MHVNVYLKTGKMPIFGGELIEYTVQDLETSMLYGRGGTSETAHSPTYACYSHGTAIIFL